MTHLAKGTFFILGEGFYETENCAIGVLKCDISNDDIQQLAESIQATYRSKPFITGIPPYELEHFLTKEMALAFISRDYVDDWQNANCITVVSTTDPCGSEGISGISRKAPLLTNADKALDRTEQLSDRLDRWIKEAADIVAECRSQKMSDSEIDDQTHSLICGGVGLHVSVVRYVIGRIVSGVPAVTLTID